MSARVFEDAGILRVVEQIGEQVVLAGLGSAAGRMGSLMRGRFRRMTRSVRVVLFVHGFWLR
jgi:hypothetical protein